MNSTNSYLTSSCESAPQDIKYNAHGCDITISGDRITVREGIDEISAYVGDEEWSINTYILGQINGILEEYTPDQLIHWVKESLQRNHIQSD